MGKRSGILDLTFYAYARKICSQTSPGAGLPSVEQV